MESTLWYLIAICGIFAMSFLMWASKFIAPNFRSIFLRLLKYPLFINRGRYWDSVTRLEALFLALFVSLNLVLIFLPISDSYWRQVQRRAAFACGVNIIPLCLGGRMGPVVHAFNVHKSTYLLLHHWIGRAAIMDGLIHSFVVVSLRPRAGTLLTSGWVVCTLRLLTGRC
jgi:hypothetical protein